MRIIFLVFLVNVSFYVKADETIVEKTKVISKTAVRKVEKATNRVSEVLCLKSDVKCAKDKAINRAEELKEEIIDGATEIKDKID